jgi:hypothetical protein
MLYDDDTCMMTRCVPARPALRDTASNDIDVEPDRACVRAYVRDRVPFAIATSRSVFKNSELLRDVVKSHTPTMIGGVQRVPLASASATGETSETSAPWELPSVR